MDLCVTGNHIEKVQAAKELAGLFLDGLLGFFSTCSLCVRSGRQVRGVFERNGVS